MRWVQFEEIEKATRLALALSATKRSYERRHPVIYGWHWTCHSAFNLLNGGDQVWYLNRMNTHSLARTHTHTISDVWMEGNLGHKETIKDAELVTGMFPRIFLKPFSDLHLSNAASHLFVCTSIETKRINPKELG